ncbi:hypothetical protein LIZ87_14250 [Lacrimispora sp. 210928-DFI.3.58]|nr:hypothetical protein [Lacrimispora sp. 210928-DFI.3.58]
MEAANYMKLRRWSLWQCCYVIVDVPEYLADSLFIQEQVRVSFGKEYSRKGSPYVLIFCRVRKKDEDRFLRALDRLEQKMLLMGYTDYSEFCSRLFAEFGEIKAGERQPAAAKAES